MRRLIILLKKDVMLELRTGESITLMIFLSLLIATAIGFGVQSAFVPQGIALRLFPTMIWLLFILSGSLAMARSFEQESRFEAFEGLLVSGIPSVLLYLSRTLVTAIIVFVGHQVGTLALSLLLDVSIVEYLPELLALSALASFGYSALGSLFGMVSVRSKLRQLLLPLIILPLILPVYLSSLELTTMLFDRSVLELGSSWFTLLVIVDVLYLVLGINLFDYVVRE